MIHSFPAFAPDAANIEGSVVQQQLGYRFDVAGVQGGNEAVEKLLGRCSMHAPHARHFLQPRTPAVERGLNGPTVVERTSAICSRVKSNTSFRTTADLSC